MTKKEAFDEINRIQDEYVEELIGFMRNPDYEFMKAINFTSPTGTGKTKMMSKLINRLPDCYFIITTLSKGQLHFQVRENLERDCNQSNFTVYGSADYKINSRIDAEDIISKIPENTKCIWLRDEGHIRTNRYDALLMDFCYKVVNFSATNTHSDIQCNFTQTMMLRTVNQTSGRPEDAINRLIEVKKSHKGVSGYNPCAIFRCVGGDDKLHDMIVNLCEKNHLKYIDITEDFYTMAELCKDDNQYDVIINKFKIVEGIDIRRAHVLYMDNQPGNNATTIQVIGRCRRNALLYRNDIDILAPENHELLNSTRECYVFYNVERMRVDTDENGELQYAFCNHVSCESLKAGSTVYVEDGQLSNGLYVIELEGKTGHFEIKIDEDTGFNVVEPVTDFYDTVVDNHNEYIYFGLSAMKVAPVCYGKISLDNMKVLPLSTDVREFDYHAGGYIRKTVEPYYDFHRVYRDYNSLFEETTDEEKYLIRNGYIKVRESVPQEEYNHLCDCQYRIVMNDKESAIIGTDLMRQIRCDDGDVVWSEMKSVSSKVGNYNKLNNYISTHYVDELNQAKSQYVRGKNDFRLSSRCNSIIGYCVEYYSKYLVYGLPYILQYIDNDDLRWKDKDPEVFNFCVIHACMMKYREMMLKCFGSGVSKYIKGISSTELIREEYKYFCELVTELGTKTAKYVKHALYHDLLAEDNVNPILSIRHIAGLADYITKDTILDVKVKNYIDEKSVRQVLAYHYLSTKRSDLEIKKVIVYDAVSDKSVVVNIKDK